MEASPAPKRADTFVKRTRILEEAARTLNRRGVTETSLADVARGLGITRTALYYYFKDPQDLVFQCYSHACSVMVERLAEATSQGGDALEVIAGFIDGVLDPRQPELAVISEAACLGEDHRRDIVGQYEGLIARIEAVIRLGVDRGQVRDCDTRLAALLTAGLISWIPLRKRWSAEPADSHAGLVAAAKTLLFDGVALDRRRGVDNRPLSLAPADIARSDLFDAAAVALAKREALLASASWLFNLKGVDATSLEEIAARVGMTKRVIYHNVGDKKALVTACYLRAQTFARSMIDLASGRPGNRAEAFCLLMRAHAEARLREDIAPLSGLVGLDSLPDEAREFGAETARHLLGAADSMFCEGQAERSIRAMDIGPVLLILPGVVEWIPKWLSSTSREQRGEIALALAEFCRIGLRRT